MVIRLIKVVCREWVQPSDAPAIISTIPHGALQCLTTVQFVFYQWFVFELTVWCSESLERKNKQKKIDTFFFKSDPEILNDSLTRSS